MDKPASRPFRAHIRMLTERSRPDSITVVAWTGVGFWLRVEVPADVLVRSPGQRRREVGRIIREHYAVWGKQRGPFGEITGYVFHSLPDRAMRYDLDGIATGHRRSKLWAAIAWSGRLCFRTGLIERQQSGQQLIVTQVCGPAIGGRHGGIEVTMQPVQPRACRRAALVV